MNEVIVQDEFDQPLSGPDPAPTQQGRRWSITTLMAARPNPQHDTKATAARWNEQYRHTPQLQVNLANFSEKVEERSPEEIVESNQWLIDRGNGIERPNPRFK